MSGSLPSDEVGKSYTQSVGYTMTIKGKPDQLKTVPAVSA